MSWPAENISMFTMGGAFCWEQVGSLGQLCTCCTWTQWFCKALNHSNESYPDTSWCLCSTDSSVSDIPLSRASLSVSNPEDFSSPLSCHARFLPRTECCVLEERWRGDSWGVDLGGDLPNHDGSFQMNMLSWTCYQSQSWRLEEVRLCVSSQATGVVTTSSPDYKAVIRTNWGKTGIYLYISLIICLQHPDSCKHSVDS